jgi:hypothetical protein
MRRLIALTLALTACSEPKEQPLTGCDDVEPLAGGMPLSTFMALNSDRACDFSGTCQYGQPQLICGEESEAVKQVECRCLEGVFKCFDNKEKVEALNEACSG